MNISLQSVVVEVVTLNRSEPSVQSEVAQGEVVELVEAVEAAAGRRVAYQVEVVLVSFDRCRIFRVGEVNLSVGPERCG